MNSLNNLLRIARQEKGLSQENVAAMLFMEQSGYCKIENGTRELRVGELQKIAVILDKPISYFLPPPPSQNKNDELK